MSEANDQDDKSEEQRSVDALWREFKAVGTQELRDRLIVHYAALVKYVANRVAVGLPSNVEQADLVSYGFFGLIDAIEKFEIDRGIKFETYAIRRPRALDRGRLRGNQKRFRSPEPWSESNAVPSR